MTQVFLLVGGTSWPNPGNWNPVNTVECIGGGGTGSDGMSFEFGGGGGGGAAYAKGTNIVINTWPAPYAVMGGGNYTTGYFTRFNSTNANWTTVPNQVRAECGTTSGSSSWATGGTQVHPTGFVGGNSGASTSGTVGGGGGGGAGGPSGAGSAGGNGAAGGVAGAGGAANNGTVAGGAASANGNAGTQFDATHGCGSGAGGASTSKAAGNGGTYGGGGGGGSSSSSSSYRWGAFGGPGLIILTWEPYVPPPAGGLATMLA